MNRKLLCLANFSDVGSQRGTLGLIRGVQYFCTWALPMSLSHMCHRHIPIKLLLEKFQRMIRSMLNPLLTLMHLPGVKHRKSQRLTRLQITRRLIQPPLRVRFPMRNSSYRGTSREGLKRMNQMALRSIRMVYQGKM
jgi:hypothetical protein